MTSGGTAARVKSADRTLELLELLAASPERRTLAELARDLDIPKSSLHGLLRTLVQRGWLEVDGNGSRYGLGVQALRTGTAYLRTDRAVRRLTPAVDWLHRELRATAQLGRLVGGHVVCLVTREQAGARPANPASGHTPAHATALGRAVLARVAGDVASLAGVLPAAATMPPARLDALGTELARTVARGYAVDWAPDDRAGCGSVAVGVPPALGRFDSIAVSVTEHPLTESRAHDLAATIATAIRDSLTGRLETDR
ncbi:helix-turn-helix domain-containing protein [Micromonospora sp. WMMD1076]|uniref:IclR family transcriptional regulator n=1 Tax=Micromonospora TaxID=1873 RepID=UPI00249C839C|nr:helix-turn-helix domain-containing protein [Micromonospora sp. WMMD1076]WFF09852.1 helix-turn-helix domain-containing protein [Micromonospora sp. WMMD1076]